MALPQFHEILADPEFRDADTPRQRQILDGYWKLYDEAAPADVADPAVVEWAKGQRADAYAALDAKERLKDAPPLLKRALEYRRDEANFRIGVRNADAVGEWESDEARKQYVEGRSAELAQRQQDFQKSYELFDPEKFEATKPIWDLLGSVARENNVFTPGRLRGKRKPTTKSQVPTGPFSLASTAAQRPAESSQIKRENQQLDNYTRLRDKVATEYNIDPADLDNILMHRMGKQKDAVSRDALGQYHIKDEVLVKDHKDVLAAIDKSDLPKSDKEKLKAQSFERITNFKSRIVEQVKNTPALARDVNLTGDIQRDYRNIQRELNEGVWSQLGGGFAGGAKNTQNQLINLVAEYMERTADMDLTGIAGEVDVVGEVPTETTRQLERLPQGMRDVSRDIVERQEAVNQLSAFINKEKTEVLGTDAAVVGQGIYSVLESVALGVPTGGTGQALISAERIRRAGKAGKMILGFGQRSLSVAPIAGRFGAGQAFDTYEDAIEQGKSKEEALKLAATDGFIETFVTMAFSGFKFGGTEDIATRLGSQSTKDAVRLTVPMALKAFGKDVAGENLEENTIAALSALSVQAELNPDMTVDDLKKQLKDTLLSTTISTGALSGGRNLLQLTLQPDTTHDATTDELKEIADQLSGSAAQENIPQTAAAGRDEQASGDAAVAPSDQTTMTRAEMEKSIKLTRKRLEEIPEEERTNEQRRRLAALEGDTQTVADRFGIRLQETTQSELDLVNKQLADFERRLGPREATRDQEGFEERALDTREQELLDRRDELEAQLAAEEEAAEEAAPAAAPTEEVPSVEKQKFDEFKNFFSDVTKGTFGKSDTPFVPELPINDPKQRETVEIKQKHSGNFDDHIMKSIPTFYETQIGTVSTLAETLPQGSVVLDIAASEGSWGKALTESSGGNVLTVSLDPNQDMAEFFASKSQVEGATYSTEAFGEGFDDVKGHDPGPNTYDAIHESMGFQFISPDREGQVAEVKRLLKPDGIFLTEQKLKNPNWKANEKFKDQNHKNKYFTEDELKAKDEKVGFAQSKDEEKSVGMVANQVEQAEMERILLDNFRYVYQYWDSGNFKGYVASDNKQRIDAFVAAMPDTTSKFSEGPAVKRVTPTTPTDENQVQETSRVSAEQRQPTQATAEEQTQTRTPQRQSEGRQEAQVITAEQARSLISNKIENPEIESAVSSGKFILTRLQPSDITAEEDLADVKDSYGRVVELEDRDTIERAKLQIENGTVTPIILDENGVILDGFHRAAAAKELGVPIPAYKKQPPTYETNVGPAIQVILESSQEEETGATLNADGTMYEGVGLVVPGASVNLTRGELTPERVKQFADEHRAVLGAIPNAKVGIFKFKKSERVSLDLNLVVDPSRREAAVEFGRELGQESLFDLGTGENIKTGADGKNPRNLTDEEFTEVARVFEEGGVPTLEQADESLEPLTSQVLSALGITPTAAEGTVEGERLEQSAVPGLTAEEVQRHAELEEKSNRGEITEAERAEAEELVGRAARAAGYDVGPVWHGSDKTFNQFEKQKGTVQVLFSSFEVDRAGFFFTPEETLAPRFGGKVRRFFLRTNNPADFSPDAFRYREGYTYNLPDAEVRLIEEKGYPESFFKRDAWEWFDADPDEDFKGGEDLVRDLRDLGYDGAIIEEPLTSSELEEYGLEDYPDTHIAFSPSQIKSAEPFTGVPIEQRFNPESPSILQQDSEIATPSPEADGSRVGTAKLGTEAVPVDTPQDSNISGASVPEKLLRKQITKLKSRRAYPHLPKEITRLSNPENFRKAFTGWLKDNLVALYNAFPEELRARATHWYDGANRMAKAMASRYGLSNEQVSAVIAVLSPQKDWFMNMAQAEQVLDVWTNHQDTVLTEEFVGDAVNDIVNVAQAPQQQLKGKSKAEKDALNQAARGERREQLSSVIGKSISTIEDPVAQAWAIRILAQTIHGRFYRVISPEGEYMQVAVKDNGEPRINGWGSAAEIEKAVRVIKDGSLNNISENLGEKHKVRSFFNNIVAPRSAQGDVTIDTHAVAAAHLMPYGASAAAVKHNFGEKFNNSGKYGIDGSYHFYADAYRQAAAEVGILPRQLQSVTWEAVRLLYPPESRRNKTVLDTALSAWQGAPDAARSQILAKELPDPAWSRPDGGGRYGETAGLSPEAAQQVPDVGGNLRNGDRAAAGRDRGVTTLQQEEPRLPKGQVTFRGLGQAMIEYFRTADASTVGHEAIHVVRRFLLNKNLPPEQRPGITDEMIDAANEFVGAKDSNWTVAQEEKFARAFERYLWEGVNTGNSKIDALFAKITELMREIYQSLAGTSIDVEITDDIRRLFDSLVTRGENLAAAGAAPTAVPVAIQRPRRVVTARQLPPRLDEAQELPPLPPDTSVANAATDQELEAAGFAPVYEPARTALGDTWDESLRIVRNDPNRGTETSVGRVLVDELLTSPRVISDVEHGILLDELAQAKQAYQRAEGQLFDAAKSGDRSRKRLSGASLDEARERIARVSMASKLAGTEWGRAGRFRQIRIEEDYTIAAMEARVQAEVNDGAPLTPKQKKRVDKAQKEISKAEQKRRKAEDALEATIKKGEREAVEKQVLKEIKKESITPTRRTLTERVATRAQSARDRLASLGYGRLKQESDTLRQDGELDGEVLELFGDVAADYIVRGVSEKDIEVAMTEEYGEVVLQHIDSILNSAREQLAKAAAGAQRRSPAEIAATIDPAEELSSKAVFDMVVGHLRTGLRGDAVLDAVVEELNDRGVNVTREQVSDIFTGYGKAKFPSKDELLRMSRELRRIELLKRQIDIVRAGTLPKKTGQQRDPATAEIRRLQGELNEAKRNSKIRHSYREDQLKGYLDALKRRLQNDIEDLEKAVKKNEKIDRTRRKRETDEELDKLREKKAAAQQRYDEHFGVDRKEMTVRQRIAATKKLLDQRIAEEEELQRKGILERPKRLRKTPETQDIIARRRKLEELRAARRKAYELANPKKTAAQIALDRAKAAAKRAVERYEEILQTRQLPGPRPAPSYTPDQELQDLQQLRGDLADAVQELRDDQRPRSTPEERAKRQAVSQLTKTIDDLNRRIASRDFSKSPKGPDLAGRDPAVRQMRDTVKNLRETLKSMEQSGLAVMTPEQKKEAALIRAAKTREKNIRARIAQGDLRKTVKVARPQSAALQAAMLDEAEAKKEWNQLFFEAEMKKRNIPQKMWDSATDVVNMSRTFMTMADVSGVLRQGGLGVVAHPILGVRGIVPMFQAGFSEAKALADYNALLASPNGALAQESGLFLAKMGPNVSITEMEEAFRGRLAKKIPAMGQIASFSERTYAMFLNKLRMDMFNAMTAGLTKNGAKPTLEEAKIISNYINIATGRGNLGKLESASAGLATAFFSPKFVVSRFQWLWGMVPASLNIATGFAFTPRDIRRAKKAVAKEYSRSIVGLSAMITLALMAKAAWGDDDEDEPLIELDPRSSSFMKIKIGNTRIDPLSGLAQAATFAARMLPTYKRGEGVGFYTKKGDGTLVKLTDPGFGKTGYAATAFKFFRSKASPLVGTWLNVGEGRDMGYNKVDLKSELLGAFLPLVTGDIYDTMREQGVARGLPLAALAAFGVGVQNWNDELPFEQKALIRLGLANPEDYEDGGKPKSSGPLKLKLDSKLDLDLDLKF